MTAETQMLANHRRAFLWSLDRTEGAKYLLFYVLPLALLAVSLSRLPWRTGWAAALYVQLAGRHHTFPK